MADNMRFSGIAWQRVVCVGLRKTHSLRILGFCRPGKALAATRQNAEHDV